MNTDIKIPPPGFVDDVADLAPLGPRPIKLLQNNSPEVTRGDAAYILGAEGGDFLVPRDGETALYKGTTGLKGIFVLFEEYYLEWPAVRNASRGGPLDRHPAKPRDVNWIVDPSTGRNICLRANGNKIEKTVYGHALIDGAPATFVFRSTAYPIGRNQANLAFHLKATIDGQDVRVVGAKWLVTSRLESNNLGRWFVPQIDLIGKFGSSNGPTLAEVRQAKALRIALKTGANRPRSTRPRRRECRRRRRSRMVYRLSPPVRRQEPRSIIAHVDGSGVLVEPSVITASVPVIEPVWSS
jgi:hypothetical protein